MKKVIGIIVIVFLCFGILLAIKINYNPTSMLEAKASRLYGDDYCKRDLARLERMNKPPENKTILEMMSGIPDHPMVGGTAITKWKCSLCGVKGKSTSTITPKICPSCAAITGRCMDCGKKRVPEILKKDNENKKVGVNN